MPLNFDKGNELKENEMLVQYVGAFKTKTGKTCIHYAYPKKISSDYEKGYAIHEDAWLDNIEVFDRCPNEPKEIKVKYEFVELNNGTSRKKIIDICS